MVKYITLHLNDNSIILLSIHQWNQSKNQLNNTQHNTRYMGILNSNYIINTNSISYIKLYEELHHLGELSQNTNLINIINEGNESYFPSITNQDKSSI